MSATWRLHQADVLAWLKTQESNSRDAAFTDNPYGLGEDPTPEEIVAFLTSAASLSTGDFMGADWQVPSVATWKELFRVLKPGAPMVCFGGTRTFDLVSLGVRLAGFRFIDTTAWVHGQGMHHSRNIHDDLKDVDPAEAERWKGHGTRQKPAFEPAMLFIKPHDGTIAGNCARWGVGGIDIDGSRIGAGDQARHEMPRGRGYGSTAADHGPCARAAAGQGRWPANVIFDEQAADALDAQAGERRSGAMRAGTPRPPSLVCYGETSGAATKHDIHASSGKASRFFKVVAQDEREIAAFYTPKASRRERDAGCQHLPLRTAGDAHGREEGSAGLANPRAGAGHTGGVYNHHGCVKPIALTKYLARMLLSPPRADGRPRRIVVPYCGSGSEVIGAGLAGWEEIDGIEREPDFLQIAQARCVHWIDRGLTAKDAPTKQRGASAPVSGGKTKQCRVCGCRTAAPGAGGRWPDCEHDDWEWVPRLASAPVPEGPPPPAAKPMEQTSIFDVLERVG